MIGTRGKRMVEMIIMLMKSGDHVWFEDQWTVASLYDE
jgi:hypothetical protein